MARPGFDALTQEQAGRIRVPVKVRELGAAYAIPVGLLLVAAIGLAEGLRMILSATGQHPSAPPGWYLCAVAALLGLTTVIGIARGRTAGELGAGNDGSSGSPAEPDGPVADEQPSAGGRAGLVRVWKALGLMALYAYALPWLGFGITNGVFAVVYLRWVAGYPVVKSLAYGLAIDIVAALLFDQAGVLLPSGVIGL